MVGKFDEQAVVWVDPMEDPFLLDRQRAKMSWKGRPYMLLRYVSHLQDLARYVPPVTLS
eukprot:SAG31_NODE_2092_length_6464_cov_3.597172_5_plen_59_part_00